MISASAVPEPNRWSDQGLYAAWLGHSTVLIKIDGFVILTDPVLSTHAGVNLGLGTVGIRRMVASALTLEEMPRPDLILLSHAHMDHFHTGSLRKLADRRTWVVTAPNTSDLLRPRRYRQVHELGWGQQVECGPLSCRAFEVNHWGARYGSDTRRGYNGYVIETERYRVLFAGDTALTHTFRALRRRKPIDLAIMPIGAYQPRIHHHCTPEQAWQMGEDAGAEHFLPVHHRTFRLGREPVNEPIERFYEFAGNRSRRIVISNIGEQTKVA